MSAFVPNLGAPLRSANSFVGAPIPAALATGAPRSARASPVTMADDPDKSKGLSVPKVSLPKVSVPKVSLPKVNLPFGRKKAAPAAAPKANVKVKAAGGASGVSVSAEVKAAPVLRGAVERAPTDVRSFPKEYQFLADKKVLNQTAYDLRIIAPSYFYTADKQGSENVMFNDLDVYTDDAFWEHPGGWPREQVLIAIDRCLKQLFGTSKLLKSDLKSIEPLVMCVKQTGNLKEFIRQVALSDLYRKRFFEPVTNLRFIELNFMHFLGRAPRDQKEISEHVDIITSQGYEAEINSYIDSEEYSTLYGFTRIPAVNFDSRFPFNQSMNRTAVLNGAYATPDTLTRSPFVMQGDVASYLPLSITKGLPSGWTSENSARTAAIEAAAAETSPLEEQTEIGPEELAYMMTYGVTRKFWYKDSSIFTRMMEPILEHSEEEEAEAEAVLKYGSTVGKFYVAAE